MRQVRANALVVRLLGAILALLVVNTLLLSMLFLRGGGSGGPAPATSGSGEVGVDVPVADAAFKSELEHLVSSLEQAAREAGVDPFSLTPTPSEVEAAAASKSLEDPAARRVLEKVEEGFKKLGLPMPAI